ncbi:winged helix-turn-helix domain-containing protein [Bacteroides sp. 224]|uniref:winged helix-turn-helix domain-containing protein n=1 Tax=Bacteroides sp. 224 TaxID=2302936 RepID=UPI0013D0FFFC|nr:winged helix-turn-helix domain-containing protein [Bacteroides sp. 224]NDV64777.1 hypothetical protein [Bacteroides sp. 224]
MIGELLKKEISRDARVIWSLLEENRRMTVEAIRVDTRYAEGSILLSLGWLARENKVTFFELNGSLAVEANLPDSSLYC